MYKTKGISYLLLLGLMLLLVGCGSIIGAQAASEVVEEKPVGAAVRILVNGDPEEGRAIFDGERRINAFVPCSTCHYTEHHQGILLGPNLGGLGNRAGSRVSGLSAEEYLYEALLNPDAYVVEGFPPHTMNQGYPDRLSEKQIDDIVAYLLTL